MIKAPAPSDLDHLRPTSLQDRRIVTLSETTPAGTADSWSAGPGDLLLPGLLAWELLGDGVRREMWLAWSTDRWAPVAVKLPRPSYAAEPRSAATLRAEAVLLGQIRHTGFQRLLHDGSGEPLPHLVLEYVEGPSLDTVIDDGPLGPDDLVLLGMHLAGALHYLHGRGFVHRDLKPENVVIREGRPVLLDLGLACPIGTAGRADAPQGSDGYRAPEQERGAAAEPAADLYALGTILAEAAVGDVDWLPEDLGALPTELATVLTRLRDPDPAGRPADAAHLLTELAGALPAGSAPTWPEWATAALRAPAPPGQGRLSP